MAAFRKVERDGEVGSGDCIGSDMRGLMGHVVIRK